MSDTFAAQLEDVFKVDLPQRPYPGLRPFEKNEWPIFFGRERMADAIVKTLIEKHLLVVHGDSGCGKSYLIRAAVLPRLEQENARAGLRWRTCTALPRETPLLNIAQALAGLDGEPLDDERVITLRRLLNFGQDAPAELARLLCDNPGDNLCILIDQLEELFGQARRHGPEEAQLLTQFLIELHAHPPPGLYVVLTMRSEFLGACAHYPGFAEVVNATQYLLPRMDHSDLLRAICEPARLYEGDISPALAERLINDAGGGQDQLPLIQHGLMLLYNQNVRLPPDQDPLANPAWHLGLEHYHHESRLAGLLSAHADDVLHQAQTAYLSPDSHVVEDLFRALTDMNADGQAIRRPRTLRQLLSVTGATEKALLGVIDTYRADGVSFLTPHGDTPLKMDELIDISHEALIRCWHKIADRADGWLIREFRDGLVWRSLLVEAESFEQDPSNVIAPAITDERSRWLPRHNQAWAVRYGDGWPRVMLLLDASRQARDRAREQALEQARRKEARRKWTVGTLVIGVTLAGLGYGIYSNRQLVMTYENVNNQLDDVVKKYPTLSEPLNEVKAELQMQQHGIKILGVPPPQENATDQ
ncbi:ATP-binding protein [Pseudomonas sp. LS1212]|uniref:ATP-binding protein n=1 Tax=Pseudomonas sp. LS1212 TaxID=2972478 RepID=UPI00215BFE43|nr:ATP-binding protein [Pseudomonas sp. LS1212]UVJ41800.1 ATP-binding protein [Pseudomonas sp. LS1212]